MIRKLKFLLAPTLLLAPMLVFGSGAGLATRNLTGVLEQFKMIVERTIPLLIGLGLLLFIWGVLRYLLTKDEIQKEEARKFMLWGIIALFVMSAVWGFVNILGSTLFGDTDMRTLEGTPELPQ